MGLSFRLVFTSSDSQLIPLLELMCNIQTLAGSQRYHYFLSVSSSPSREQFQDLSSHQHNFLNTHKMEKGKVNELFRSKFGNQRLRSFIKRRVKLLPSIKALPSLCKCLTKEIKLLLVFPAMRGRFHDKNAEPSALCVATQSGHP